MRADGVIDVRILDAEVVEERHDEGGRVVGHAHKGAVMTVLFKGERRQVVVSRARGLQEQVEIERKCREAGQSVGSGAR